MKRTMLYQVDKDGHISPVFASSQPIGRNTRRVWRRWVSNLLGVVIMLALFALPQGLYDLAVWIFGGGQ